MTQGIWVIKPGESMRRPKSKKEIKEAVRDGHVVVAESTANRFHPEANEWDGRMTNAPVGTHVTFVGPDPRTDRRFYGTIEVKVVKGQTRVVVL